MSNQIINLQFDLINKRMPFAVATVVEIFGSSSAKPGAKAVYNSEGRLIAGWIGGGCAQAMVAHTALECFNNKIPTMVEVDLDDEIFGAGMPCGGKMKVYVEPVLPKPMLWLMGAGLLAETLCVFADRLGFAVVINDNLPEAKQYSGADQVISDDPHYESLMPGPEDYVVVATHHKGDYFSLSRALNSQARYIALIASHKRADLIKRRLSEEGFADNALNRIHSPAGLNIGAQTPEEIALAVVSEMVLIRRGARREAL